MRFSPRLPILACTLALSLSGCVAVPLAQLAVSQMAPTKSACPGCTTGTATGAFDDISKALSDSFHKLPGSAPDNQKIATDMPTK